MPVFLAIEVAHDEVGEAGFCVVQGQITTQMGESTDLLSQIWQKAEIEFGVAANPSTCFFGADGQEFQIINGDQDAIARAVGEKLKYVENIARCQQKQGDRAASIFIDALYTYAPRYNDIKLVPDLLKWHGALLVPAFQMKALQHVIEQSIVQLSEQGRFL